MRAIFPLLLVACQLEKFSAPGPPYGVDAPSSSDVDADGYSAAEDCDDNNSMINPAEAEICDGIDNNCDGQIDEGVLNRYYEDADGDGYGNSDAVEDSCELPLGYVPIGNDCDDTDSEAYPGNNELCDGVDNDCDGETDEDLQGVWYADSDGDGFGDAGSPIESCTPGTGYVEDDTDCDDSAGETYPGAVDACDGADNDCDGEVDEAATEDAWLASLYHGVLYEIVPGDGSYTELTELDSSSLEDLGNTPAFAGSLSDSSGIAYAYDGTNDRLLRLDVCTGVLTEVGESGIISSCGLTLGPGGELYGLNSSSESLVVFDRSDGSAAEVGPLGFEINNCGLTYDCATDTLIGMHVDPDEGTGLLFSIDASTGAATVETTLDTSVSWGAAGLQYDPSSGRYLAATTDGLFAVDITDGAATRLVELTVNSLTYIVDACE